MLFKGRVRRWTFVTLMLFGSLLGLVVPLSSASSTYASSVSLQQAFSAAAQEFGVPESVLLALSYNVSRWEHHSGEPSTSAGYGVMHLVELDSTFMPYARGDELERSGPVSDEQRYHMLSAAAQLLGVSPEILKQDPAQNIRGGAALLAQYARDTVGAIPANEADWYGAVAKYSGSQEELAALGFAEDVFATISRGVSHTTSDGQQVVLAPKHVTPNRSTADSLPLRNSKRDGVDCPNGLACYFIPAYYDQKGPGSWNYGNYDVAARETDGLDIEYIVIHDTETSFATAIDIFSSPEYWVSSHYVLRASDGLIAQMVDNKDVAWTAGNWYINSHSINLEHEGVAIEGASWYSERMYLASARLVRYLAKKYDIPLDRAHIIGHDDVPGPTPYYQSRMHWDPGPFWDWSHYMELIGAPITPSNKSPDSNIVTINPNFATNKQVVSYCFSDGCRDVEAQSASFVYLHTAPSFDAPLIDDPHLPGAGNTRAHDWGNKAATGQQFYRFATQGDWDGIYFSGQEAWFYNPDSNSHTVPGDGILITPKAGKDSIPVYGRAYPTKVSTIPLNYSLPAGQIYVAKDLVQADYYSAKHFTHDPSEHTVVEEDTGFYVIFFNHRLGFVRADDVEVVSVP